MLSLEQLSHAVQDHLGLDTEAIQSTKWIVGESSLGGRGIIAVQDIKPGEVLFVDHPLLCGPRSGINITRGCTVCGKIDENCLFKCSKCACLLCSEQCRSTGTHHNDCAVISRWHIKVPIEEVDEAILSRALTAIRALLLDEDRRKFMVSLEGHALKRHGVEVRALKEYFDIPEDDEKLMLLASYVLDACAYQIAIPYGSNNMCMRGLYPVAGLMNHGCTSNTRHTFNTDSQMTVRAAKHIPAGTEIVTCYIGMLWCTSARRAYLFKTKNFLCKCDRCADPTERGTFLSALKCFSAECPGILLPKEPLKFATSWYCLECNMRVPPNNICAIQAALGSMMATVDFTNLFSLERFLFTHITKFVPKSNHIVVDLQCRLIWILGETDGVCWNELSEQRLELKESICRGTLRTLAALGAGDAHLRALLLYHLHAALAERARRRPDLYEELKSEIESTIEQAYGILQGDISAPPDLELRRHYLGPGSDRPQEERFNILHSN